MKTSATTKGWTRNDKEIRKPRAEGITLAFGGKESVWICGELEFASAKSRAKHRSESAAVTNSFYVPRISNRDTSPSSTQKMCPTI
jgi:hypothetical protein